MLIEGFCKCVGMVHTSFDSQISLDNTSMDSNRNLLMISSSLSRKKCLQNQPQKLVLTIAHTHCLLLFFHYLNVQYGHKMATGLFNFIMVPM